MSPQRKLDVWLDDVRPAPEGWTWATSVREARALIKRREVRRLSLDHDLGMHPDGGENPSGYRLCLWMAETGKWPDEKPVVHSQNPVGAEAMRGVIERYWPAPTPETWTGELDAPACPECGMVLARTDDPGLRCVNDECGRVAEDVADGVAEDGP